MPHRLLPIRLVPLCAWFCALPAQTFVVDAAGGPGAAFTSIVAAVAAVPDGAVLLVQPGTYNGFTIDGKSLSVLGRPGVVISGASSVATVRNLAANQAVTLHEIELVGILGPAAISCQSCQGEVVLQSCRMRSGPGGYLDAMQCARLRVAGSEFTNIGGAAMQLFASDVFVSSTVCTPAILFEPGIYMVSSNLEVADSTIGSGGGGSYGAAIAFSSGACSARLLGATRLSPGVVLPGPLVSGAGTLRIDPSVQLVPGMAPAIEPGVAVSIEVMPVVAAVTGPIGGMANGSLVVPAGGIGGLWADASVAALPTPLFVDPLFVDPTQAIALAQGLSGSPLQASYAVPNQPWVRGMRIAWQGWSFDPVGGFQASNAVVTTHW